MEALKGWLIALSIFFGVSLTLWTMIETDVLALGLNIHIYAIINKVCTVGVTSVSGLAAFFHVALPPRPVPPGTSTKS